jgi:hypothetical protein
MPFLVDKAGILNFGHLVKVLHEGEDFTVAESESFFLAEHHDLAERDGPAVIGVDFIEKFLKHDLIGKL